MSLKLPDILILSGVQGDTRRYRTFHLYEQLRLAGIDCTLSHLTDPNLLDKASQAALVFLHRVPLDGCVKDLLAILHRHEALVIADVDDLLFDPAAFRWIDSPDFQDPVRVALYQEEMRRHRLSLDTCQAVLASTKFLADRVHLLGKLTWVHRNAFSLEMLELSDAASERRRKDQDRIVIGYASGTPTHDRDFAVIKPAIQHVLRQHPHTELVLVGPLNPGADWGGLANRVRRLPKVPWRKLPEVLAQFDINLAPLVTDNPFAQSKSEIKYMEAALVRVPTIASPMEAFNYAIYSGKNGILASNTSEWIDAFNLLVGQPDARQDMGARAYSDVMVRYHPITRGKELVVTLSEISESLLGEPSRVLHSGRDAISSSSPSLQAPAGLPIDPAIERSPTLLRMALYSLRYRGVGTLLKQGWVYFRRLLAPVFPFKSS